MKTTITDDFGHEVTETRVLPLNGGANIICGVIGYHREIANRRDMNRTLSKDAQWDLPAWPSLRVYFTDGQYANA